MTPNEIVILYFFRKVSAMTPLRKRSAICFALAVFVLGKRTKNSSPPNLATRSYFLTFFSNNCASLRRTLSACTWPCLSFTFLKKSMSTMISDSGFPRLALSASMLKISLKKTWLYKPVFSS